MKPTFPTALLAAILAAVSTLAQGTFRCANSGDVSFPFEAPLFDRDGVTQLTGSEYSAQFYAGPLGTSEENLAPVGPVVRMDAFEGTFDSHTAAVVPGVPWKSRARIQMRVWDNEGGVRPTWESATGRGQSASFDSLPLSHPSASGLELTPLRGLKSAALSPGRVIKAPAPAVFKSLFVNSYYQGMFRSADTVFREFAAGGSAVITELTPGTNPEPLYGPLLVRRSRLSADLQLASAVPAPMTNFGWSITGISADGSLIAANRWDGTAVKPRLIRKGVASDLPGRAVFALSSDGRFALVSGEGNELRRLNVQTLETVIVRSAAQPNTEGGYRLSNDGSTALLGSTLWRESDGSATPLPTDFAAARLSGDGRTVVGRSAARPAYWSAESGLVVLHAGEPGVSGALSDASFDGGVLVGWAKTPRGRLQVWTRAGKAYRVAELLPNGSNQGLANYQSIIVERISHDGRSVYGSAKYPNRSAAAGLVPTDAGWVADLVFPEDGARVTTVPQAGGMRLSLRAPAGFRYQFEHGNSLGAWTPVGEPVSGTGATLNRDAAFDGDAGFFRVVAQPE